MKRYLSPTEAAYVLGISRQRVCFLLKASRIVGAFRVGKHWAIPIPPRVKGPK